MEEKDKKAQILKVAEKLFSENGFSETSVRSIAKSANVNVAMVSYYFGGKDSLLKELSISRSIDFRNDIEKIFKRPIDYFEKVDQLIEFTINRLHRNRAIHKIIDFEYAKNSNTIDFQKFIQQKKQNYKMIYDFVEEGQEKGLVSKSINIPLTIQTIVGTYFSFYYNKRFFRALHNLDEDITMDIFVSKQLIPHIQRTINALLTYED